MVVFTRLSYYQGNQSASSGRGVFHSIINHIIMRLIIKRKSIIFTFFNFVTGAFYFSLGNVRPCFRSSVNNIQLFILCKVVLLKKYGIDKILQPFMEDIKCLESVSKHLNFNLQLHKFILYSSVPNNPKYMYETGNCILSLQPIDSKTTHK